MRLRWTRAAVADLVRLRAFIAREAPRSASEVATRILDAVSRLTTTPGLGRPGRIADTRELAVPGTRYVVPYRVVRDEVELLRVLHTSRRWPSASLK